jgi:hypothetical protein
VLATLDDSDVDLYALECVNGLSSGKCLVWSQVEFDLSTTSGDAPLDLFVSVECKSGETNIDTRGDEVFFVTDAEGQGCKLAGGTMDRSRSASTAPSPSLTSLPSASASRRRNREAAARITSSTP